MKGAGTVNSVNIVIVEDDSTAAGLLKEYLEDEDIHVSGVFFSGEEALDGFMGAGGLPDLVLMDIKLPGISGIEVTRILKDRHPGLEVVVQTIFEDSRTIMDAIKAGASGYLLKGSPKEDLLAALREVMNGGSFLTGRVARLVLKEFQGPQEADYGLTDR
jgi:DNA-binding NarL/FixJ family response regulator